MSNTFLWTIRDLSYKKYHESSRFVMEGCEFYLSAYCEDYCKSKDKFWQFILRQSNFSLQPISYSISIIDRDRRDFITTKGRVLMEEDWRKRVLMMLDASFLDNYKFNSINALLVRFTLLSKGAEEQQEENLLGGKGETRLSTKLSKDLEELCENKMNTDCILRVNNVDLPVHRAVLSARSPVFAAMFHHDTAESRSGIVNIPDMDANVLRSVLQYIYSGCIRGMTANTAVSMYIVADKYSLVELKSECFAFLTCNLTLENVSDVAVLAHTYAEKKLEDSVVTFIESNSEDLGQNDKWESFSKSQPSLACKYLYSALVASKKGNSNKKIRLKY